MRTIAWRTFTTWATLPDRSALARVRELPAAHYVVVGPDGIGPTTRWWDLDFAPRAAFIKVFLEHYFEFDDQSAVDVGLLNIRFRDQNAIDQTITFPDIDAFDHVSAQFNGTMTHVTFGLKVKAASGALVWTLGFWG